MSQVDAQYDDDLDLDDDSEDEPSNEDSRQENNRRAQSRIQQKADKAKAEAAAAKKELLFVKAGIDTDSKLGKLLLTSYDGELTIEAVKLEATEIGLLQAEDPGPDLTTDETSSTDERQQLASGAQVDTQEDPDPVRTALEQGQAMIDQGGKEEEGLSTVFRALASDQRNWTRPVG